jgi:hypothetical protein
MAVVKRRYDSDNLFVTHHGVGSDIISGAAAGAWRV